MKTLAHLVYLGLLNTKLYNSINTVVSVQLNLNQNILKVSNESIIIDRECPQIVSFSTNWQNKKNTPVNDM